MGGYDQVGDNRINSAVLWIQETLLGTVATAVAVVAISSIGFLMLTGRIDFRGAAKVFLGCFVIFGASLLAAGIQLAISGAEAGAKPTQHAEVPQPYYPPAAPPSSQSAPVPYDPYAGAALAPRQ